MTEQDIYWIGVAVILTLGGGAIAFLRRAGISNNCGDLVAGVAGENETRATLQEGSRTMRIIAEERGKTIKTLMNQLKEIEEDHRKKCEELKEYKEDFEKLQDLAIWMTGCGYNFIEHKYFMDNKYLMTKGVTDGDGIVKRLTKGAELVGEGQGVLGFVIKEDPLLSRDEMYLKTSDRVDALPEKPTAVSGRNTINTRGSVKTGWGQD